MTKLSNEEMLNHPSKAYNPSSWVESVERMMKYGAKFYEAKPDEIYSYSRFFTEYKLEEGLYILKSYHPHISSLSNNGFVKAFIIGDEIFTMGFGKDRKQAVVNNKEGRKWLVENVCSHGVMVTSSI